MRGIGRVLVGLGLLLSVSACALPDDVVDVGYDPISEVKAVGADEKSLKVTVEDVRGKFRDRIGIKGFEEYDLASIRTAIPVRQIVEDAFTKELTARQVSVEKDAERSVQVAISAMHNHFHVGFTSVAVRGVATLQVTVLNKDSDVIFEESVAEVAVKDGMLSWSKADAVEMLEAALTRAMTTLFENEAFMIALEEA